MANAGAATGFDALNAVGGGNLATKADLEAGLARLEARLTVRLYGGLFAVAALIAALKLFP